VVGLAPSPVACRFTEKPPPVIYRPPPKLKPPSPPDGTDGAGGAAAAGGAPGQCTASFLGAEQRSLLTRANAAMLAGRAQEALKLVEQATGGLDLASRPKLQAKIATIESAVRLHFQKGGESDDE
jgi:hypothetical protein